MHIAANYDHIHNEQDHKQDGDRDEACLHPIPPLSLMRHGVDNEKHRPVGNPNRKV
jgi:hypothetical protein